MPGGGSRVAAYCGGIWSWHRVAAHDGGSTLCCRYARQLSALMEEFPAAEPALVEGLLVDQAGDVLDVRVVLRLPKPLHLAHLAHPLIITWQLPSSIARLLAPPKPPRSPSAASKAKTGKPPRASKGKAGTKPQPAVTLTTATDTPASTTGGEVEAGAAAAPQAAQPAAPSATGAQSDASDRSHRTQHHLLTSQEAAQPPDAPGAAARLPIMPSDSCAAPLAVEAAAVEKVVARVGGAKRKAGPARGRVAKAAALGKGSGVSGGSEQDSAGEEAVQAGVGRAAGASRLLASMRLPPTVWRPSGEGELWPSRTLSSSKSASARHVLPPAPADRLLACLLPNLAPLLPTTALPAGDSVVLATGG
ncbi:hypothetical protein HaLaN_20669 [Haematococcus lacustris]|uniref:Uncharacterized protein n=1 Tax=Haematococcus lacustris TaxID=44745 RepID=A0A699ZXV6_HAELA|nr:hypothetical protein HaLaN_20669 [Haematococcus lacustris]